MMLKYYGKKQEAMWDDEIVERVEREPVPLVPVTNNPLPFGSPKKKQTRARKVSAENYRKSLQDLINFMQMPMSMGSLLEKSTGSLRAIASLFKAYDGDSMRSHTKPDLIRFICGFQLEPENYRPIKRLPGIEYPQLEDQQYRKMFAAKLDPWKRPGRP